jgi:SAM-dependent methyltransferase
MRTINPDCVYPETWGSGDTKSSTEWMGALTTGSLFEGCTVLDYGCGGGRLANYLSMRLEHFTYFGLEPAHGDGPANIQFAKHHFADERTTFDLIGSYTEIEAIKQADLVVLGSVFTHLLYEDSCVLLSRFLPVLFRGGRVVASVFVGESYELEGISNLYGCPSCYSKVTWSAEQLDALCYEIVGEFVAQGVNHHTVISVTGSRCPHGSIPQSS